jgi:hypothetical protein
MTIATLQLFQYTGVTRELQEIAEKYQQTTIRNQAGKSKEIVASSLSDRGGLIVLNSYV